MSVGEMAKIARLYDTKEITNAARHWLEGAGAPFMQLKRNEVAAIRRIVSNSATREEMIEAIVKHVGDLAKRRKGASPWDRLVTGKMTMLHSLVAVINIATDRACSAPVQKDSWIRINSHLSRSLSPAERKALDNDRLCKSSLEFIDCLVRSHQAGQYLQKGEKPCQPPQAS